MDILIDIGVGAAKLALGLFAFFCMIGAAGFMRDLLRGKAQEWVRREGEIGARRTIQLERQQGRLQ